MIQSNASRGVGLFLFLACGIVFGIDGGAVRAQLSNNPDDYNVAKYEQLYAQATQQLQLWQQQLQQKNQLVHQRNEQLKNAKENLSQLQNQKDAEQAKIQQAQAQIQQLQQSITNAQGQIASLNQQIQQLNQQIQQLTAQKQQQEQAFASANTNAGALEAQAAQKQQQAAALLTTANQKKAALDTLKTQLDQAKSSQAALSTRVTTLNQQKTQLQGQVQNLKNQLAAQQSQLEKLKKDAALKAEEAKRLAQQAQEAEAKAKQAEADGSADAAALKKAAERLRQAAVQARQEAAQLNAQVEATAKQVAQTQTQLASAQQQVGAIEQQITQTQAQLNQANAQVAQLTSQVQQAQELYAQAKSAADQAQSQAAQALASAQQARSLANQAKSALDTTVAQLQSAQQQLAAKQNQLNGLNQSIGSANQQISAKQQVIAQANQKIGQLNVQIQQQQGSVQSLLVAYQHAVSERDQVQATVHQMQASVQAHLNRLNQVQANLQNAMAYVGDLGRQDGSIDGASEGSYQGAVSGDRDGRDVGDRDGREQGTTEGRRRAQVAGAQAGEQAGQTAGHSEGSSAGQKLAQSEGPANGRRDGLEAGYQHAYEEGHALGYAEGEVQGHAMGGLEQGYQAGYPLGQGRAKSDAEKNGAPEGRKRADVEFQGAQLKTVTLPNRELPIDFLKPVFAGGGSAGFQSIDWTLSPNYRPKRSFPQHPSIQQSYLDGYRYYFIQSAQSEYDRVYRLVYEDTYRKVFTQVFEDYANRQYPEDYQSSFSTAKQQAYAPAYEQAYKQSYQQTYQPLYEAAFTAALPERKEEGLANGRKAGQEKGKNDAYQADLAQGKAAGDKEGYEKNYPLLLQSAIQSAYEATVKHYQTRAVIAFDAVAVVDANEDGVFAPGEKAALSVTVKNFGLVSQNAQTDGVKGQVRLEILSATSELQTEVMSDPLVAIPGQSRTTVTGVAPLALAENAELGSVQTLRVQLVHDGKIIGAESLQIRVGYPYEVVTIKTDPVANVGHDNDVVVTLKNVSKKLSQKPVSLRLASMVGDATVLDPAEVVVGQLPAGATKEVKFRFRVSEESTAGQLLFELRVLEEAWMLGYAQFTTGSAEKWSYNANAHGLLVATNANGAKLARQAVKSLKLPFDVWDLRVMGALTTQVTANYAGKLLVFPSVRSDVSAEVMAATNATVKAFIETATNKSGGRVLAGVRGMPGNASALGSMIEQMAKLFPSVQVGSVYVHEANRIKNKVDLQRILLASDIEASGSEAFGWNLLFFDLVNLPLEEKITRFLGSLPTGDAFTTGALRAALVYELSKEIIDDRGAGEKAYKHPAYRQTQVYKFRRSALLQKGIERQAMLRFYPDMKRVLDQFGSSNQRSLFNEFMKDYINAFKNEIKD